MRTFVSTPQMIALQGSAVSSGSRAGVKLPFLAPASLVGLGLFLASILLTAAPAAAAPNAAFISSPIQGTAVCLAPCAVHFDATPTTDTTYQREFHSLRYEWDFGDPGSGNWRYGPAWASDKNFDFGPIAGHVFDSAGTYSVELTVTNPAGQVDTSTRSVTVTDPTGHFSSANTFCFANRSGTFQGCPLDRNNDGVCEIQGSNCRVTSDFDNAIANDCNADSNQRWCTFRKGDTFLASREIPLNVGSNGSPGLVNGFGTGPKPVINHNQGEGGTINPRGYWTFTGFRIDNNNVQGREGIRLGGRTNNLVYDMEIVRNGGTCWQDAGGPGTPRNLNAVFEMECVMSTSSAVDIRETVTPLFWKADRALIYGVHIDSSDTGEFNARTVHASRNAFKHNFLENPQDNHCPNLGNAGCGGWRHNLSWRAYDNAISPGHPPSEWNVIAFNEMERIGSIEGWVDFCASASCRIDGGNNLQQNLIYEFNFHYNRDRQPASSLNLQHFIEIQRGGDFTVRNNIFDATGHTVPGSKSKMVALGRTHNQRNVHVYNNTVYHPETLQNRFTICEGVNGNSGHLCRNNVAWIGNLAGDAAKATGTFAESNNFLYCRSGSGCDSSASHPFTGNLPRLGATRPEDFRIRSSATELQDRGYDFSQTITSAVQNDFFGSCRGGSANGWDIGAHEVNGRDCGGSGPAPPPPVAPPVMLPES